MKNTDGNNSGKILAKEKPPNPKINLRGLVRDPLNFFLTLTREYGDVVCYRPAPEPAYLVNDPSYIRHILLDNQRAYSKETYSNLKFKSAFGNSLLTSEGNTWQRQRQLMQPTFRTKNINLFSSIVIDESINMLSNWQAYVDTKNPLDIGLEMGKITLSVILISLFGVKETDSVPEVVEAIAQAGNLLEKQRHPRFTKLTNTPPARGSARRRAAVAPAARSARPRRCGARSPRRTRR